MYVSTLQKRSKWITKRTNPQIGKLALLKENHVPQQDWVLTHKNVVRKTHYEQAVSVAN